MLSTVAAVLSSLAKEAFKSARRDTLEALEATSSAWDLVQLTNRSTLDVWRRRAQKVTMDETVARTNVTAPRTYASRSWTSHLLSLSASRRVNPFSSSASFQERGVVGVGVERLGLGTVVEGSAVGGTGVVLEVADLDGGGRVDVVLVGGLVAGRVTTSSSSSCCCSSVATVVVVLLAADLVVVLLVEPEALLQTGHGKAQPNTLDADSLWTTPSTPSSPYSVVTPVMASPVALTSASGAGEKVAGAAARNPLVRNSFTSPLRALQVEDSTPDEDCTAENTARARREATENMTGWTWTAEVDSELLERTWAVEADSGAAAEDSEGGGLDVDDAAGEDVDGGAAGEDVASGGGLGAAGQDVGGGGELLQRTRGSCRGLGGRWAAATC